MKIGILSQICKSMISQSKTYNMGKDCKTANYFDEKFQNS